MTLKGWKLEIHDRDCNKCKICGSKYGLSVHHKIPKARGGSSSKENCVCWCKSCHNLFHKEYGLTTSDDFGNPIGEIRGTKRPQKRKLKKHCKKHRR